MAWLHQALKCIALFWCFLFLLVRGKLVCRLLVSNCKPARCRMLEPIQENTMNPNAHPVSESSIAERAAQVLGTTAAAWMGSQGGAALS